MLNKWSLDLNTETVSGSLTMVGSLSTEKGFLLSELFVPKLFSLSNAGMSNPARP